MTSFGRNGPRSAKDALERALRDRPAGATHVAATLAVPPAPLDAFWSALDSPDRSVWIPPEGPAVAGLGEAWRFDLRGPEGVDRLREAVRALFAGMRTRSFTPQPSAFRLFGGMAFAPGASTEPFWAPFGDGAFVLPRWSYFREGPRAWLTAAFRADEPSGTLLEDFERIHARLEAEQSDVVVGAPSDERRSAESSQLAPDAWTARIEAIRRALERGEFEKLVAARRAGLRFQQPVNPLEVLRRLGRDYPDCTRFLLSRSGVSFVGATPERLFSKRGARLSTVALAGSISAGEDAASGARQAERLLSSAKDLREHALVAREISRCLAPLTTSLEHPEAPRIRRLRGLLHLETPFEGALRPEVDALEIMTALHPTPAVGGIPKADAVAWIGREEEHPRGWYSGPVGWIDSRGDAELVVAIRSGLLAGRDAYVYAGAGIMPASDPMAEYEETRLKQQPLMRALGLAS